MRLFLCAIQLLASSTVLSHGANFFSMEGDIVRGGKQESNVTALTSIPEQCSVEVFTDYFSSNDTARLEVEVEYGCSPTNFAGMLIELQNVKVTGDECDGDITAIRRDDALLNMTIYCNDSYSWVEDNDTAANVSGIVLQTMRHYHRGGGRGHYGHHHHGHHHHGHHHHGYHRHHAHLYVGGYYPYYYGGYYPGYYGYGYGGYGYGGLHTYYGPLPLYGYIGIGVFLFVLFLIVAILICIYACRNNDTSCSCSSCSSCTLCAPAVVPQAGQVAYVVDNNPAPVPPPGQPAPPAEPSQPCQPAPPGQPPQSNQPAASTQQAQ